MDTYNLSCWIDHFTFLKEKEGLLSPSLRHLLILDGHKSHVSLEVVEKARRKGLDMITLPSHTSHGLQPLDVSCFGPVKQHFRAFRNAWNIQHPTKACKKETLAQWMSLALQKALTTSNITSGFKACGIWLLNFDAMNGKMGPAHVFHEEVPLQVQVEEILEHGGIPTMAEESTTHYFVDVDASSSQEEPYNVDVNDDEAPQSIGTPNEETKNFNQFLRIPQEPPRRGSTRHEALVDYSQSHILTSDEHVQNLQRISKTKENIALERAKKAKSREVAKKKRVLDKEIEKAAKEKRAKERDMARKEKQFEIDQNRVFRAADVESERGNKEIWTQDVIEEYGENLQRAMQEWDKEVPSYIDCIPWQCKENQKTAKARLEAKKERRREGPAVPSFPPLL